MKRRTFLKSVIAVCAVPSLLEVEQVIIPKKVIQAVPEAIYTAKTIMYDARMALGDWMIRIIEEDMVNALSGWNQNP